MRTRSHWENAKNPFFVIIFAYFWWAKIGDLGHTATVWGCSRDLRRVYKLEPSKSARFAQKLDVLDVFGYERNLTLKQYLLKTINQANILIFFEKTNQIDCDFWQKILRFLTAAESSATHANLVESKKWNCGRAKKQFKAH